MSASPDRFDLLVAGHVNIDRFLEVARLPDVDRTVPIRDVHSALGGTAANIALAAARRGVRVALHARVGGDFPENYAQALRDSGVDVDAVERVERARSPSCYIVVDRSGQQFTLIDQGPMAEAASGARRVPKTVLGRADWLHLATGPPTYQLRLQAEARRSGLRVAVDPAQEIHYLWKTEPLRQLLAAAEVFFGNEAEARAAARRLRLGSVRRLVDLVPLVVVTLGARGALAFTRRGTERVPTPGRPPARHYVGAGDNFRGGFYAAWFRGEPLARCLREGSAAAADWIRSTARADSRSARARPRHGVN